MSCCLAVRQLMHVPCRVQLSPALLEPLAHLRNLTLWGLHCDHFDVPDSWGSLTSLTIGCDGYYARPPGNLPALSSLVSLKLAASSQHTEYQIREPLDFLTQIKSLRKVFLGTAGAINAPWDAGSLFHLMEARLMIENTPGCSVELLG